MLRLSQPNISPPAVSLRRLWCGLLCSLALFLSLSPSRLSAAETSADSSKRSVVIGGDRNFPPYEFLDGNGKPAGFNVELSRAIAEVMGMQVEFRLGNWDDSRRALQDGSVDVLQGLTWSKARAREFDFSPPHNIVNTSVFGRRGAHPISRLQELRGKEVIVQKGGSMHDFLADHDIGARLILVETHAAALRLLASGRHDYALVGNLPGLYLGKELGLSNIVPVGGPYGSGQYGYAVKKGNEELLSRFSEGLAILKNTGRYQQIHDKWLGVLDPRPLPFATVARYAAIVALPLLLILGGTVLWSRTLQKRINEHTAELQKRQQQLIQADKMASLGILVSGVAHEINNPTGLILFNLPVLKKLYLAAQESMEQRFREEGDFMIGGLRYSLLREEAPRLLDEMHDGARRIKRIVDDLKDFARKDDCALDESVDLNLVVQASVRLLENSIKKATRRFRLSLAPGLPCCRGNAQRIEQVVVNLILNACQALPDPEKGIEVATALGADGGEIIVTVRDEGVGIPEEHLSHLTDPFFTTKRDLGGTGLGLSVSAGIVKEHQGRLEFRSEPGQGSTALVALPAQGA
jgi:signal transduction histidine kinase